MTLPARHNPGNAKLAAAAEQFPAALERAENVGDAWALHDQARALRELAKAIRASDAEVRRWARNKLRALWRTGEILPPWRTGQGRRGGDQELSARLAGSSPDEPTPSLRTAQRCRLIYDRITRRVLEAILADDEWEPTVAALERLARAVPRDGKRRLDAAFWKPGGGEPEALPSYRDLFRAARQLDPRGVDEPDDSAPLVRRAYVAVEQLRVDLLARGMKRDAGRAVEARERLHVIAKSCGLDLERSEPSGEVPA